MKTRTILVVEDDPNDESLTLRALRRLGTPCSVVVARSGTDALDFLSKQGAFADRQSDDPDVMFLDNSLPGVPGDELVRRIRSMDALKSVPLVIFSGTSDEVLIKRCLDAGANGFLQKPIDMGEYLSDLCAAAEKWLPA